MITIGLPFAVTHLLFVVTLNSFAFRVLKYSSLMNDVCAPVSTRHSVWFPFTLMFDDVAHLGFLRRSRSFTLLMLTTFILFCVCFENFAVFCVFLWFNCFDSGCLRVRPFFAVASLSASTVFIGLKMTTWLMPCFVSSLVVPVVV